MTENIRTSRYDKPVPEPHYIPGYTGHCPDLHEHIGMTYSWATHAVLEDKPYCADRLSPIRAPIQRRVFPAPGPRIALTTNGGIEDDRIIRQRRAAQKYPILGTDIAVGYRGHVPKEREMFGKTHRHIYRRCIADFERQQRMQRGGAPGNNCNCCNPCNCRQME